MTTLAIMIKAQRADIQRYITNATAGTEGAILLAQYFRNAASGHEGAEIDVQYNATDPVAASGTLTLVSAVATDAITIGTTTFTFTSSPTLSTDVEVDGATDTLDAAALAAAINAHTTVNKIVLASSALGVVTITAIQKGVVGNFIPLTSADVTITASGAGFLADGTGGATNTAVTYNLGYT